MIKNAVLVFLLQGLFVFAVAQEDLRPTLIPPHPDAAAIARYGEIDVGAYTGTPSVSIPLYEVKYNDLRVPIVLNYDASGVKVSQQASWVGLNWSLTAGGVITRSVRSLYDHEAVYAYTSLSTDMINAITSGQIMTGETLTMAKNLANGEQDGEPDLYFFSFNGRSGRFIETADGFVVLDRQDIRIEKQNGWVITDEKGIKYVFGVGEATRPNNYKEVRDFTSSWYLRYIESPNGAKIFFRYKSGGKERTPDRVTKSYDIKYNASGYPLLTDNNRTHKSYSYILDRKILERIEFPGGELYFSTDSGRLDIQSSDFYGTYSSGHSLASIEVRSFDGSPRRYFKFLYSYFQNGSGSFDKYRLKLDQIIEAPDAASVLGADTRLHRFEYYNPDKLPSLQSEAQDHWGYYTGRSNALLPSYDLTEYKLNIHQREPSQTAMTNGALKKIFYPTGGYAELIYQPHDYGHVGIEPVSEEVTEPLYWVVNAQKPEDPNASRFSTDYSEFISIDGSVSDVEIDIDFNYTSLPNSQQLRLEIIRPTFGSLNDDPIPENIVSEEVITWFSANSPHVHQALSLAPGGYFMKAVAEVNNTSLHATIEAARHVGVSKTKKAGGLRIHKLLQYDPVNNRTLTKRYSYIDEEDPDRSSGVLVTPVKYETPRATLTGVLVDPASGARRADMINGCEAEFVSSWTEVRSSSVIPLGQTSGSHVGYKRVIVEELDEEGETLGKTIEKYTAPDRFVDTPKAYPGSSGTNYDLFRGKLLSRVIYDEGGRKVKEVTNYYDFDGYALFSSLVLVSRYLAMGSANSLHICAFDFAKYNNMVGKALVKRTVVKEYAQGNDDIYQEKKTSYYYDKKGETPAERAHLFPTRTVEWSSGGDSLTTTTAYIIDQSGDAVSDEMFARHIIAPPTEMTREWTRRQQVIYNRKYYYDRFDGNPLLQRIEDRHAGPDTETVIEFEAYDDEGRILQMKDRSGVSEVYLWNKQKGLPSASVINASLDNVYIDDFEGETGTSSEGDAHTGLKSRLTSFSRSLTGLTNGTYVLSYWLKQDGNWMFVRGEVPVTGGAYSISVTGQLDDLRFYPVQAQVKTFAYSKSGNLTSIIDENNEPLFFEYDGLGRLKVSRDSKGNILKTLDYNLTPVLSNN